jgi:DNA-binding transcriptional LysR family regulator
VPVHLQSFVAHYTDFIAVSIVTSFVTRGHQSVSDFTEMRVFVCAIERGAFSAAAKELRMTPSGVSKLVTRLKRRLGVRLVNRTTRRLALTPEGETYFQSGRRLIEEFKALESGVAASSAEPRGLLRVNTGLAFGLHQLAPVLGDFQARYPEIRIELSLTDRVVDLHAEQVDVAIRSTGSQRDSSLMARKLADTRRVICASHGYLDRFGHPKRPADLAHHRCIVVAGSPDGERWPFRMPTGGIEYVEVGGPIRTDNSECALQLALAGTGIIRIGELLVGRAIAEGRLVPLLTDAHKPEKRTTWAVFPAGMQTVPRVRVFLDFLVERFACAPWRVERRLDGNAVQQPQGGKPR